MNFSDLMNRRKEQMSQRTLAVQTKIKDIIKSIDNKQNDTYRDYIKTCLERIQNIEKIYNLTDSKKLRELSLKELQEWNKKMYEEFSEENYSDSYANPIFATSEFGKELGQLLCYLYYQLESLTRSAYLGDRRIITFTEELFVEIYNALITEKDVETIKSIIAKHQDDETGKEILKDNIRYNVDYEMEFVKDVVLKADLKDLRYLYWFGYYVSDNEIKIANYLNILSQDKIQSMADTFTEGYRIGFETTGKDITKKESASVIYPLGFETIVRASIKNFDKMNMKSILSMRSIEATEINRQVSFDHKSDNALYFDKEYVEKRISLLKEAFEEVKQKANGYAGPAVIEKFGEKEFNPVIKEEAIDFTDEQRELDVYFGSKFGEISRQYIIPEERSFTIIAYPIPEIGEKFEEIFNETVKLNTLDYMLYRNMQQKIIDALDTAEYVKILGKGENKTDIKVKLHELQNPEKQTNFENCVADVNIPVGEVFTSPELKGTNGKLHVTSVYLNGLLYKNLEIDFKDGMIDSYTCTNFEKEEENKKYLDENVLFYHKTLPMGEFAIGTNTTAYKMGIEYDIQAKMPILIAEKTGPHFAVGDTCYSHVEDMAVFNPDGKEIIARTNEVAELRHTDPSKAYVNCHTDITIPYNELLEITAISKDGKEITIIRDGRFVLEGTEELNKPLDELDKMNK